MNNTSNRSIRLSKIFIIFTLFSCSYSPVLARVSEKGKLSGVVTDPVDSRIISARIFLKKKGISYSIGTNKLGEFELDVEEGIYNLIIEAEGFKNYRIKNLKIEPRITKNLVVRLKIAQLVQNFQKHVFELEVEKDVMNG